MKSESAASWASVPQPADTPAVLARLAPDAILTKWMTYETRILLRRVAAAPHFLPSAFPETAVHCCEPGRALR